MAETSLPWYALGLDDLETMNFANSWVCVEIRQPTIVSRIYLRIGEPSEEHIDAFPIGIGISGGQAAARDIAIISIDAPDAAPAQAARLATVG